MRSRRRVAVLAGLAATSAVLVGIGLFLASDTLERADRYASVGSLFVGIVGLALSTLGFVLGGRRRDAGPGSADRLPAGIEIHDSPGPVVGPTAPVYQYFDHSGAGGARRGARRRR